MTIPYATPATIAPYQETPDPPLYNGQRLTRAEFERRYHLMPHLKKAELLEGVVSVPSPLHYESHSERHGYLVFWIYAYLGVTPRVRGGDNATVRLLPESEVQPDAFLWIDHISEGTSRITEDDYLAGPPELIIEVAASSSDYDMTKKRRIYERSGVQEYIVWQVYAHQLVWWELHQGAYRPLVPNNNGIIASRVFPGLHLHVPALIQGDIATVLNLLTKQDETSDKHFRV